MTSEKQFRVVLDPGHGGKNLGTQAAGIDEKHITLDICKEVALSFHGFHPWIDIELTRYEDEDVSFEERAQIAQDFGADFVISVHANANRDPHVRGVECYVWPEVAKPRYIARALMQAMPQELHPHKLFTANPGKWFGPARTILEPHWRRDTPAVLLEVGYATNPTDLPFLLEETGKAMVASAIRMGICRTCYESRNA